MKKVAKIFAYVAIFVVVVIIGIVAYVTLALPNVGPPENIKVEITPQRLERGKYLAINVSGCLDCHSAHDWTKFGGPIDTNQLGSGGEKFDAGVGFPGNVTVPNLTPHNLKNWTDGELLRAITTGVKRDGSAIFPLMPWPYYSKMDREDLYSIIAYIRSLKPIDKDYPKSKLDFPLNIIVHTMPQKATLGKKPDTKDTLKYGKYLVQSAACKECHSQDNKGTLLPGLEFAGGRPFKVGAGTVRSTNITSDVKTGIGGWTKEGFIARFKAYNDQSKAQKVGVSDFQTVMPWWNFSKMSEGDLASIYTYLKTLKPVKNAVVKFSLK
ncbi:c-type cytochrome [Mucilaginibacter sp. UR6-11]|uniref:c-type cytochrome n=1 Tax=Mucilaginibacter sp. UR6-11 TaxID=1435644 RepID=UPI001E372FA5|nr:c-type cytochrome [Mucilaginibacter sp. UR6-11]MCC8426659.1 c-type cytochrome [Mucilaginibacter sp. UR6-11]